jgi:hypothetical protein
VEYGGVYAAAAIKPEPATFYRGAFLPALRLTGLGRPMEDHMAVDLELWIIFAAVVAFLTCGCIYTSPKMKPLKLHNDVFGDEFDRAA